MNSDGKTPSENHKLARRAMMDEKVLLHSFINVVGIESRGEVLPLIDDRIFCTFASVTAIRLSRWMPWYTVSAFIGSGTVTPRPLLMADCILTTFS